MYAEQYISIRNNPITNLRHHNATAAPPPDFLSGLRSIWEPAANLEVGSQHISQVRAS
jgi:hypothetical protein